MMNIKKRICILTLAFCMALTLLTACGSGGTTPTGDNSTPGVSGTSPTPPATEMPGNTPEATSPKTAPPEQLTDKTPPASALQATEPGTLSVAGARYYGGRCSFIMPEGWMCEGTQRMDDADALDDHGGYYYGDDGTLLEIPFTITMSDPVSTFYRTSWGDPSAHNELTSGNNLALSKWNLEIIEYDDKIANFEIRTAEEWYISRSLFQIGVDSGFTNMKAEKTTVDGNPAVRVTWQMSSTLAWNEFWAIDTTAGLIKINLFNGEVSGEEGENRAWVEDFMSTFQINS